MLIDITNYIHVQKVKTFYLYIVVIQFPLRYTVFTIAHVKIKNVK